MQIIYVALENHSDHELIDLLTENLPWIKRNFSTWMMECVPIQYQNQDALRYLFRQIKDYRFDFAGIDLFNEEEVLFLNMPFVEAMLTKETAFSQPNPDLKAIAFVERRIELISSLINSDEIDHSQNEGLEQMLGIFKRYRLFFLCLAEGIQLKGMEPSSYQAGLGIFDSIGGRRDASMFDAIVKAQRDGVEKGIFMLLGASHGITLIQALASLGKFNASFIRLATSHKYVCSQAPFSQWLSKIAPSLFLGPENNLAQKIIERSSTKASQTASLEATLHMFHGPALPDNLEHCLKTGFVKSRT
jgi:hypothetical protein